MASAQVDILMYHSISDAPGPTNIAPAIFADQIAAIAGAGVPVITLDTLSAAKRGEAKLPEHSLIITFDDGFQDYADVAWPILRKHGFDAINYLPTDHMGGVDAWEAGAKPRALMSWDTIRALQSEGALFGSHTLSHPFLTQLSDDQLNEELTRSKSILERELGTKILHIAPPYGDVDDRVRARIAPLYETSVGTHLYRASLRDDLLNLPRIEMFYFTDLARWRQFLTGNDRGYLRRRRILRRIRQLRKLVA